MTLLLLALISWAPRPAVAAEPEKIEIAVEDAADIWSRKDGTGFANDVVEAAFRAMGIQVKWNVEPYARCKADVIEGRSIACFSMSRERTTQNPVRFSDKPIFVCNSDYFYNASKPIKASREAEIPKGTIVGTVLGYEYPDATDALKERGVLFEGAESEDANLKKLALGRIDLAIVNTNKIKSGALMIKNAGVNGKVAFAFRGGILESFIGFSKKHPQGERLRTVYNKGYAKIAANGMLRKIESKWAD